MTGDDRLRSELDALERAAPGAAPPIADRPTPRRSLGVGVVAATVIVASGVALVALGPLRPVPSGALSPPPSPSAPAPNPPAVAETRVGDFILTISSPKTVWAAQEEIEVSASLWYVGDEPDMTIGEGVPPIGFTIRSATGEGATVGTGHYRPCFRYAVSRISPLVARLTKDGILVEEGIPAASPFGDNFSAHPDLQLEPGEWTFTAAMTFAERTCGEDYRLEVSVVLEVADLLATDPPAPSPSAAPSASPAASAGREVYVAGIHAMLPPGWSYQLPTFVSWGPAKPVIYFSNQPMHDECVRTGNSATCDRPIDQLLADGVLIEWWGIGYYWMESPPPLPSGSPYEVGGLDAVRYMGDVESCGLRATETERVVIRRSNLGQDDLTICSRDLTPATRAELEDLLASIEFVAASE